MSSHSITRPLGQRIRPLGLAAALLLSAPLPAAAQASLPPCSMGDRDFRDDATLAAARHMSQRHISLSPLTCQTVENQVHPLGSSELQVLRAKVFESASEGQGVQQSVNLIVLTRRSQGQEMVLARFLVPYDVSRDEPYFFPMVNKVGDGFVLQLGERIRTAYRITGENVTPFDSHAWAGDAGIAAGSRWVAGQVRRVDFMQMIGFLSVFRSGSDDPATPGSAFDTGKAVQVALAFEGDRLVGREPTVVESQFIQDVEDWTAMVESQEEARKARRRLPPRTEPCEISGWSVDADPAGLNVRAEPSARSRVVGIVPPAWVAPGRDGDAGQTYRAEFRIAGYRDGWFLIRSIKAPGAEYGERYPRSRPQPHRGQGWVSARMVGAALANANLPVGQLLQAPSRHAAVRPVRRTNGEPAGAGDVIQRLHACSGGFGLIEIEGVRGWWSGLCSNQVTNCS
ncbi:hypothetical protein E8L99_16855 [Phreatobacter aquaticus]|uniref:SH3 domain-containing protein n=1 Tax=Phreatobacter aquaticus TaxID=2570229 RepID=A0A4D7QQX8_9HYPH|nr:hypothetical protein [Phreatobacter aquaticus]QCK87307.1 hypothetical protein E8L99_16855 [Phreatobacter aquaticus]